METITITITKSIVEQFLLINKFYEKYKEIVNEFNQIVDIRTSNGKLDLDTINIAIGRKLDYDTHNSNENVKKLFNLKHRYLSLYNQIRNSYESFGNEIDSLHKEKYIPMPYQPYDACYQLLKYWYDIVHEKLRNELMKGVENEMQ